MNSFLFKAFLVCFFLMSQALCAQSGTASSKQLHPISFLADPLSPKEFLQVSYINPFGIKSIQDFRIDYKNVRKHGSIQAAFQSFGIKGYSQYHFELGYILNIKSNLATGIILLSNLLPRDASRRYKFFPGSSLFSSFKVSDQLRLDLYINHWTKLWFGETSGISKPGLSLLARINANENVRVISGLNYTKGFAPICRAGVVLIANQAHTIVAGLQSGPAGFWLGYSFVLDRMKFILTIQSGGIFGYEPGSSIKYFFN